MIRPPTDNYDSMAEAEAALRKKIIAIQHDPDLTAQEKARKCQDLMTYGAAGKPSGAQS